jgi:predicted nucleotidyltransferase
MKPSLAVQTHRDAIVEIVERHHACNPRIFGSAARGSDREGSDLDLLVDPLPGMSLFDIGGIIEELENLLGVPVDVVTPNGVGAGISEWVLSDLRPL